MFDPKKYFTESANVKVKFIEENKQLFNKVSEIIYNCLKE
jgi:D-sedoheptulose 7-phosphate isomerase